MQFWRILNVLEKLVRIECIGCVFSHGTFQCERNRFLLWRRRTNSLHCQPSLYGQCDEIEKEQITYKRKVLLATGATGSEDKTDCQRGDKTNCHREKHRGKM